MFLGVRLSAAPPKSSVGAAFACLPPMITGLQIIVKLPIKFSSKQKTKSPPDRPPRVSPGVSPGDSPGWYPGLSLCVSPGCPPPQSQGVSFARVPYNICVLLVCFCLSTTNLLDFESRNPNLRSNYVVSKKKRGYLFCFDGRILRIHPPGYQATPSVYDDGTIPKIPPWIPPKLKSESVGFWIEVPDSA